MKILDHRLSYWDEFYGAKERSQAPSAFALFVHRTIPQIDNLLDVGCGDGRDSLFFASSETKVLGIDGSAAAIELCQKSLDQRIKLQRNAVFRLSKPGILLGENDKLHISTGKSVIYSRFFLHAVEESVEDALLSAAGESLRSDSFLCLEFRTIDDANKLKTESPHFRRYIDTSIVSKKAIELGMVLLHEEIGTGLARYGAEDPIVARLIFRGRGI